MHKFTYYFAIQAHLCFFLSYRRFQFLLEDGRPGDCRLSITDFRLKMSSGWNVNVWRTRGDKISYAVQVLSTGSASGRSPHQRAASIEMTAGCRGMPVRKPYTFSCSPVACHISPQWLLAQGRFDKQNLLRCHRHA